MILGKRVLIQHVFGKQDLCTYTQCPSYPFPFSSHLFLPANLPAHIWYWHEISSDISFLFSFTISSDPAKGYPLRPTEEAADNFHLAIDAEFVKIQNEEYALSLEGERKILRPARLTPGRVSALRISDKPNGKQHQKDKNKKDDIAGGDTSTDGDTDIHHEQEETPSSPSSSSSSSPPSTDAIPFIDDYIRVSEPIVNYETKYSGLSPGDLEAGHSRYALQPLKTVYKKLWLLLNLGCTFVGHGLDSDFRVLNIFVPEKQVIDTVKLFHRPEAKRFISLRYLAWVFLKDEDVQRGWGHDSIVDAYTALRLWRKYKEFVRDGTWTSQLRMLYQKGPRTDWLPPEEYRAKYQALKDASLGGGGGSGNFEGLRGIGGGGSSASLGAALLGGEGIIGGGGSSTAGGSANPSGRNTPETGFRATAMAATISAPVTPEKSRRGGSGGGGGRGGLSGDGVSDVRFSSPLR